MYSLYLFADRIVDHLPGGSSREHLTRVFRRLVSVEPSGGTRFPECLLHVEAGIKRRGLVVVLSDFMDDPERIAKSLGRLRMRGHDVIAFQIYEPGERDMDYVDFTLFRDLEDGSVMGVDPLLVRDQYRRLFDLHQTQMKQHCLARQIDHAALPVADDYDEIISTYLRHREMLLK